jgi:hypothetical protein
MNKSRFLSYFLAFLSCHVRKGTAPKSPSSVLLPFLSYVTLRDVGKEERDWGLLNLFNTPLARFLTGPAASLKFCARTSARRAERSVSQTPRFPSPSGASVLAGVRAQSLYQSCKTPIQENMKTPYAHLSTEELTRLLTTAPVGDPVARSIRKELQLRQPKRRRPPKDHPLLFNDADWRATYGQKRVP